MRKEEKGKLYFRSISELEEKISFLSSLEEKIEFVFETLQKNLPYCFWVGFYFPEKETLRLGPSRGPLACAHIPYSGVCGAAVKKRETVIVSNVHEFEGHHACDPRSNSEIVIPIFYKGDVIAVLDVDSEEFGAFDEIDKVYLERIISYLSNIDKINNFK